MRAGISIFITNLIRAAGRTVRSVQASFLSVSVTYIDTLRRKPCNSVLEFFTENQVMLLPIVKFHARHHGNTEIRLHCTQVDHTRKYVLVILGHFT